MPGIHFGNTITSDFGGAPPRMRQDPLVTAIKQAQLTNLLNESGFQNRQISLAERNAETNKTLGFANLSLEQKKAEVGRFLAENNVKHDEGALAEANRHNVVTEGQTKDQTNTSRMTQLFGDLSRMPVTDVASHTKLLADFAAENGFPELQKVLAKTAAATPAKKGDYSEATGATPVASTPVADALASQTPGYDPELGKKLLKGLTDVPLAASNLGGQIYNYGIAAPSNLINSIVGLPPMERAKWAGSYAEALGYKTPIATTPTSTVKITPSPTPTPNPNQAILDRMLAAYDGPPGYYDTTSPKKKSRMKRASTEFAY